MMPARNGLRRRWIALPVVALVTVALPVASAAAQAPGLPRTFQVKRVDSPAPVAGGAFGWGVYSADLTGDFKQDLLVAQAQVGTATEPNKIFIFNGATGAHVDTIEPPENNPLSATGTYQSPEMGFVYVETMPDIGSCPGGDGADAGKICDLDNIAAGDGIPEILVGSRALRVNATIGSLPPTNADRPIGRGYVIDGATRAVLKRIDMPVADRQQTLALAASPAFARTMASSQGMPPCAGSRAENNDGGVGPCPPLATGTGNTTTGSETLTGVSLAGAQNGLSITGAGIPANTVILSGAGTATLTISAKATATASGVALTALDARYPRAVRIGDLNGGGQPDIVVTARGFAERSNLHASGTTAAAGSHCATLTPPATATTCGAGKVWVYAGEDIVGTDPEVILETAIQSIKNPHAQTTGGEYGGNLFRVGDVTGPGASGATALPDGVPDFVIPFRGAELPLTDPDAIAGLNMGAAHLFSGSNGVLRNTIVSPDAQIRSQFSGNFNAGRAVGDLGATTVPDILLPAPMQDSWNHSDEGKMWVFNGDSQAGGGGEQSWNFSTLTDPEPYIGGNFGGGLTGVGDLVGGPGAPANEVLAGGFRFDNFTEASQNVVPDVNFMNATLNKNLMTIPHPESGRGDGFGVGIIPMGDLNGDGFLDFAVSAYFTDVIVGGKGYGGAGRAWIFTSDNSPLPPPPAAPAPTAQGPSTPATEGNLLQPGRCANRTIGTDAAETLKGTLAGDQMFGFAGDDMVMGFQGQDCIDGGAGTDTLKGGDDNDKLIGSSGGDRIYGEDGRDDLFGSGGNDRIYGSYGRDMAAGGAGNDLIQGGADADRLFGEPGKDRIIGGGGLNHIDAGSGNDSIEARNGERDRIICGKGRDRVRADSFDLLNGCEVVTVGRAKKTK